jgi:hypothetical protein
MVYDFCRLFLRTTLILRSGFRWSEVAIVDIARRKYSLIAQASIRSLLVFVDYPMNRSTQAIAIFHRS